MQRSCGSDKPGIHVPQPGAERRRRGEAQDEGGEGERTSKTVV